MKIITLNTKSKSVWNVGTKCLDCPSFSSYSLHTIILQRTTSNSHTHPTRVLCVCKYAKQLDLSVFQKEDICWSGWFSCKMYWYQYCYNSSKSIKYFLACNFSQTWDNYRQSSLQPSQGSNMCGFFFKYLLVMWKGLHTNRTICKWSNKPQVSWLDMSRRQQARLNWLSDGSHDLWKIFQS